MLKWKYFFFLRINENKEYHHCEYLMNASNFWIIVRYCGPEVANVQFLWSSFHK